MRLEFSIYRYNPDVDDAPRMQDYTCLLYTSDAADEL
ncbi:hypothetical protein ACX3VG_16355, partial [Escherichia coli]